MPKVVKAPDHEMMLFNERLGRQHGAFLVDESGALVHVAVKGRLMRDDQVVSGVGALSHIVGGHHVGSNAGDRRVGIAGLEGIDRFDYARSFKHSSEYARSLAGRQPIVLCHRGIVEQRSRITA